MSTMMMMRIVKWLWNARHRPSHAVTIHDDAISRVYGATSMPLAAISINYSFTKETRRRRQERRHRCWLNWLVRCARHLRQIAQLMDGDLIEFRANAEYAVAPPIVQFPSICHHPHQHTSEKNEQNRCVFVVVVVVVVCIEPHTRTPVQSTCFAFS